MKKKVTIVLILLVLFILAILSFIGFSSYQTITTNQKNLTVLTQNRLEYASQRLLIEQQKVEDQASTLLVDNDVREIRQSEPPSDQHEYLLKLLKIRSKLEERLINGSEMDSISLYWPQKDILISTESSPNLKDMMKENAQKNEWKNTDRGLYFFMSYTFENQKEETVVAIKAADSLLTNAQETLASNSDEASVLLPDGQLIGGSKELQRLLQEQQTAVRKAKEKTPFRLRHSDKQFLTALVPNSHVSLITTLPSEQTDTAYGRTMLFTILSVLFVVGFGFVLVSLYYRNVLSEISLLTSKLQRVEEGDYDVRIEHLHQNEFDYLFNQFNLMTSSIQRLFQTLAKEM